MARSLMELYGGGMGGPTTNYQLGGRIASAQRGREYQGEMRALKSQAEEAARRQKKSGMWGSIGSFLGGTVGSLLGPAGTAAGAAIGRGLGESGYKKVDVSGGKYGQQTRGDIAKGQEAYQEGGLERALVSGIQAGVMPEVYGGLGKWAKGLGAGAETAAGAAGTAGAVGATGAGAVTDLATMPGGFGMDMAGKLGAMPTTVAASAAPGFSFGDAFSQARGQGLGEFMWQGNPYHTRLAQGRGGGLVDYMVPKMQGGGTTSQHGYNPTLDPMGTQYGYGTATDPLGALKQMGMAGIAADPNLAQYMGDLPQFGMGYEQQIGDIRTGAQKGLMGLAQPTAPAATSFAGEGASGVAQQQARTGMMQQYGTQRRGVVEGYQADVLGAIRDIEQKGEFEFQSPWGKTGETEEDWRRRTAAEQDLLAQQGTQLYSQQGLYGLQDPTQGQPGMGGTTGLPGQQQQQQQWGQTPWGQSQQQQNPWQQQQQQTTTGWPTGG